VFIKCRRLLHTGTSTQRQSRLESNHDDEQIGPWVRIQIYNEKEKRSSSLSLSYDFSAFLSSRDKSILKFYPRLKHRLNAWKSHIREIRVSPIKARIPRNPPFVFSFLRLNADLDEFFSLRPVQVERNYCAQHCSHLSRTIHMTDDISRRYRGEPAQGDRVARGYEGNRRVRSAGYRPILSSRGRSILAAIEKASLHGRTR